jgi:hypothetical protein
MSDYDEKSEEESQRIPLSEVVEDSTAVHELNQRKESVDVQQPRGDLQGLRLHPIGPFATVHDE